MLKHRGLHTIYFHGRGEEIMKKILVVLSLMILLILPKQVLADCAELKDYTHWILEGEHTIVFYLGNKPLASLNIPYCEILPSSSIQLLKSYVCDSDNIVIDSQECSIIEVKVMY
jgi:hypothetical protein